MKRTFLSPDQMKAKTIIMVCLPNGEEKPFYVRQIFPNNILEGDYLSTILASGFKKIWSTGNFIYQKQIEGVRRLTPKEKFDWQNKIILEKGKTNNILPTTKTAIEEIEFLLTPAEELV